ncbi:hypothetical protein ACFL2D_01935 [Patescibacteria group bacterium]
MNPFSTVLVDFDGVMTQDLLYANCEHTHPDVFRYIQEKIFGLGWEIPLLWMRGSCTAAHVNKIICKNTRIGFDEITLLLEESVRLMKIDPQMLEFVARCRKAGIRVALVTDNMDVFTTIGVAHHRLNEYFPLIVNSYDYGLLKNDYDGKLFDIVCDKLDVQLDNEVLLVDNSSKKCELFRIKGGSTHLFVDTSSFLNWARDNHFPS